MLFRSVDGTDLIVTAAVTRDAVEDLGLEVGSATYALVKSTEVQLAVDLIELLETNKIAPELALAALAIVRQDYERKLREGREL